MKDSIIYGIAASLVVVGIGLTMTFAPATNTSPVAQPVPAANPAVATAAGAVDGIPTAPDAPKAPQPEASTSATAASEAAASAAGQPEALDERGPPAHAMGSWDSASTDQPVIASDQPTPMAPGNVPAL
jgi:hypothetical protein